MDGTKVKANASRHKATSHPRRVLAEAELKAQIDALLERARRTDAAEDDDAEVEIPAEIAHREARLTTLRAAKERLEARSREADLARAQLQTRLWCNRRR